MFLKNWVEMGGFELNHHWHGINVLSVLECALLAATLCALSALFAKFVRRSRRLTVLSLIGALSFATAAYAANTALSALSASGAIAGANLIYVVQTAGVGGVKATFTQVATFINSLFSGDFTCTSGGACTLKNTGPGATGPIGSGSTTPVVTIDAQGRVTGLTTASITGAVSSVTGGIGVTVSPTTGAVVVSSPVTVRNNTATTDTITSADKGTIVTESNASAVAVAITTAGFVSTDYFTVKNKGAGLATYTPSAGTIDGNATLTVKQNQSADLYFDGTNYWTLPGRPTNVACADLTNGTALCSTAPGTGVATALAANIGSAGAPVTFNGALGTPSSGTGTNLTGVPVSTGISGLGTGVATAAAANLSAAGGLTSTIASGTSAMGTSAIASAACATVVTTAATNTATTDVVLASFNGDPTAVTGYVPATAGMLTIISYPTANNVNFKVCNNTSASITPGAITLNFRVVR